jgi:hypothetical protein
MTLNDLKETVVERLKEISGKISESNLYITLSERYKNSSPLLQKTYTGFAIFLVAYFVYSIPAGFVDASKEYEESFTTNRELIRGLFRSARNPTISPERFKGQDFVQMKSQVESVLANVQVIEAQKGTFSPANRPLPSSKVPSVIQQNGMTFEVKKLNLKQVVALSEQISSMHPNTKLASLEIRADSTDAHYFNVKYTLSSLNLPMKNDATNKPQPFKSR